MTKSAAKVSKEDSRRPPCKPPCGVHELVARAMRGKYVRHGVNAKVGIFALPIALAIPRVRTYHTKEPSRFVHALSARPHIKVWRGLTHMRSMCVGVAETGHRGSDVCADGMKSIFFYFGCWLCLGFIE